MANPAVHYSLLVFEMVIYDPCNITGVMYKGMGRWEGVGGGGGGCASQRQVLSTIRAQTVVLCSQ